jgi:hypothetical protein
LHPLQLIVSKLSGLPTERKSLTEFCLDIADEEDGFVLYEPFDVGGHGLIVENKNK